MPCSLLDLSSGVEVLAFPKIKITASLLSCLRCSTCFKIKVLIYMVGCGGRIYRSPVSKLIYFTSHLEVAERLCGSTLLWEKLFSPNVPGQPCRGAVGEPFFL